MSLNMQCALRGAKFWAGAYLNKVHAAACDTILENDLFQAQV
jgi:hypothetical protein